MGCISSSPLYYHVYALDFFLHSAVLASVNQIPAPTNLIEV